MSRDPLENFLKQNRSVPTAPEKESQQIWARIQNETLDRRATSKSSFVDRILKMYSPGKLRPASLSFACLLLTVTAIGGYMYLQNQRLERRLTLLNTPEFSEAVDWQFSIKNESFI